MPVKTLEDLFTDGVKDIYYAERKIIEQFRLLLQFAAGGKH